MHSKTQVFNGSVRFLDEKKYKTKLKQDLLEQISSYFEYNIDSPGYRKHVDVAVDEYRAISRDSIKNYDNLLFAPELYAYITNAGFADLADSLASSANVEPTPEYFNMLDGLTICFNGHRTHFLFGEPTVMQIEYELNYSMNKETEEMDVSFKIKDSTAIEMDMTMIRDVTQINMVNPSRERGVRLLYGLFTDVVEMDTEDSLDELIATDKGVEMAQRIRSFIHTNPYLRDNYTGIFRVDGLVLSFLDYQQERILYGYEEYLEFILKESHSIISHVMQSGKL